MVSYFWDIKLNPKNTANILTEFYALEQDPGEIRRHMGSTSRSPRQQDRHKPRA